MQLTELERLRRDNAALLSALVALDEFMDFGSPVGPSESYDFPDPSGINSAMESALVAMRQAQEPTR